jgi:hypothetical protein
MNEYTPRQLAALAGLKGPRHITDLCNQGLFPGARKTAKGWRIPEGDALAWLTTRETEIDILPPEGIAVTPRETAETFVLGIVKKALSEVDRRNSEVVAELKEEIAELRKQLDEASSRNSEEVSEVARLSEERSREVMEAIRMMQEQKKKPGLVARVVKRLLG